MSKSVAQFFSAARALAARVLLACLASIAGLVVIDRFVLPVSTRWRPVRDIASGGARLSAAGADIAGSAAGGDRRRTRPLFRHSGVHWGQLEAAASDFGDGASARGASTLDMQTVKNLFLRPSHSVLRKAIEIPLTLALDLVWPKRRILEVDLNVAEWGEGVFGAEAAARRYFHKSAAALDRREAVLLAGALPNPKARDPRRPKGVYARLIGRIALRARQEGVDLDCLDLRADPRADPRADLGATRVERSKRAYR